MNISQHIKRLRAETCLSQQAFATACDLSIRAIAKYEAGATPDLVPLFKLRHFALVHERSSEWIVRAIEQKLGFPL